ncbi:hypothetical protein CCACVL1_01878 [Corchorus capsularis]|uniref:Uncharacterized protein n=1 Tax=Corchorus capsularis TaxID=210143 RepID=A0A1R3KEF8_COCAP|nr:hypothetical protein CCACVL1_01878 [Corchorus capsularis]
MALSSLFLRQAASMVQMVKKNNEKYIEEIELTSIKRRKKDFMPLYNRTASSDQSID